MYFWKEVFLLIFKTNFSRLNFYSVLPVVIYAGAGYFDQIGEPNGWKLVVIRILIAGTALLSYVGITWVRKNEPKEEDEKELVI